jgi:hypothetical protein
MSSNWHDWRSDNHTFWQKIHRTKESSKAYDGNWEVPQILLSEALTLCWCCDRYQTLVEALMSIPQIQQLKNSYRVTSSSSSATTVSAGMKRKSSSIRESGEDELWCTHCMDDPSIELCAFCGCKVTITFP